MEKLEQALAKLEETQEKLESCGEDNIKLMTQAQKDMNVVLNILNNKVEEKNKKSSPLKRLFRI